MVSGREQTTTLSYVLVTTVAAHGVVPEGPPGQTPSRARSTTAPRPAGTIPFSSGVVPRRGMADSVAEAPVTVIVPISTTAE
jgi:hypothetical protein